MWLRMRKNGILNLISETIFKVYPTSVWILQSLIRNVVGNFLASKFKFKESNLKKFTFKE